MSRVLTGTRKFGHGCDPTLSICSHCGRGHVQCPSPCEIRRECERIRQRWSESEAYSRTVQHPVHADTTEIESPRNGRVCRRRLEP